MTKQDVSEWLVEHEWIAMGGVPCRALMIPVTLRFKGSLPWQELFDEWQLSDVEIPTPADPILTWIGVIQWIKGFDEVELRVQDATGRYGCVWAEEVDAVK
jgi:hypothetical protein